MLSIAIVVLSLIGLWNAFYFTFAYYGRVKKARWIPGILCAREGSSCVTVVHTPYARVFGVPNSLLGIFFYSGLLVWNVATANTHFTEEHFGILFVALWVLLAAAGTAFILGIYLIYALVKKIHTHCPLCYLAHSINTVLFAVIIYLVFIFTYIALEMH